MPTLSDADRAWIKRRLGVFAVSFSEDDPDDIQDIYDDAEGDKTKAVAYGFEALLTGAIPLTSYSQGQTREEKGKIYDRLKSLMEMWQKRAGTSAGTITIGTLNLGIDAEDDNA